MNNMPKIELLSNIIALTNSEEYEPTLNNLSRDCKVPLPYMRKTLITMLGNKEIRACIDPESAENDEYSLAVLFSDSPEKTSKQILNGDFDNTIWRLKLTEEFIFPLTRNDRLLIKRLGEISVSLNQESIYEEKDNTPVVTKEIRFLQKDINFAIDNGKTITFDYRDTKGQRKRITCFPYEIITNLSDNWLYLLGLEGSKLKNYRLDRIESKIVSADSDIPAEDFKENRNYMWGVWSEPEPTHYIIRINTNNENIISKIRNETRYRSETCKFTDYGDYYIYEDDVMGHLEFRRWIQSYGNYMTVIEPRELRDTLEEITNKTLDFYEKSREWHKLKYLL